MLVDGFPASLAYLVFYVYAILPSEWEINLVLDTLAPACMVGRLLVDGYRVTWNGMLWMGLGTRENLAFQIARCVEARLARCFVV